MSTTKFNLMDCKKIFNLNCIAATTTKSQRMSRTVQSSSSSDSGDQSDQEESESSPPEVRKPSSKTIVPMRRSSIMASAALGTQHYGSFYLRMGAVGNYLRRKCEKFH